MNIGIIGAGNMGQGLGKRWARAGHQVMFSYARDRKKLDALGRAGTPAEAARFGEVVLLSVPWGAVDDALAAAGSLAGKILISCCTPLKPDLSGLQFGFSNSGAEEIARKAKGARVVEAFNSVFAQTLQAAGPPFGSERATVFYCGDDAAAKGVAAGLIQDAGFEAIDGGPLAVARYLEPMAMFAIQLAYARGFGPGFGLKVLRP